MEIPPLAPVTIGAAFLCGAMLGLVGSIKVPLAQRLKLDESRVGGLLAGLNLLLIPLMLLAGILVDHAGARWVLIVGALVTCLALFALAMSRTYGSALFAVVLAAAGGACLSTSSTVLMPDAFFKGSPAASLNVGYVFFGLGALVSPAVTAVLVPRLALHRTLGLGALVFLALTAAAIFARPTAFPSPKPGDLGQVLGDPALWLAGLVFLLYGPLEGSLGMWATSYLSELGVRTRWAAYLLTGFWLAFLAGRLVTAVWQQEAAFSPTANRWLILGLAVVGSVVLGNLAGTHSKGVAAAGLLFVGALFGPIFPTLVGLLFHYFEPNERGTAFGAMFAIGTAGSLFIPPIIATYARRTSVRTALRIPTLVALLLAGSIVLLALWCDARL